MDVLPSLKKEFVTLESAEQIINPYATPLVEREPPILTSLTYNTTPESTPRVLRSSRVIVQTNQDYIPSMLVNKYETMNTQV